VFLKNMIYAQVQAQPIVDISFIMCFVPMKSEY